MTEHSLIDATPVPVKLRIADYLLLDEAGAFGGYAKTELLGGELFCVNAQHRPHARLKIELYGAVREAVLAAGLRLRPLVEASVAIPPHSAPEPDVLLTSEPDGDGLVPSSSVSLIIEVTDTTLTSDLTRKAAIYAEAGIPEYWVADVDGRMIHQMWGPGGGGYVEHRRQALGTTLSAASLPIKSGCPRADPRLATLGPTSSGRLTAAGRSR